MFRFIHAESQGEKYSENLLKIYFRVELLGFESKLLIKEKKWWKLRIKQPIEIEKKKMHSATKKGLWNAAQSHSNRYLLKTHWSESFWAANLIQQTNLSVLFEVLCSLL